MARYKYVTQDVNAPTHSYNALNLNVPWKVAYPDAVEDDCVGKAPCFGRKIM